MGTKRGAPWCDKCGAKSRFRGDLSCTGQCPDCGIDALVYNIHGLVDPGSVPYKSWKLAYECSKPGRPRNTTPPANWNPPGAIRIARYSL